MTVDAKLVRDLFLAATDVPAEERATYVAAQCGDDPELLAAVQRLLAAHEQPANGLSWELPTAGGLNPTGIHAPPVQHVGDIIGGRYKLLQQIGLGGMGAVWMAEQKEPVKRKVAIKLVKAGMDSQQVLARFEAERQALALMDHPNIAKVFDGGMTDQGRPYFVMEFVKGVPLTEYCNDVKLSLKERLQLFIPVCQAVQHAHQKGIIHRDLKPSNILICLYDGKPVPKVIDFGLAKAMHQSLTENTIHTAVGMMVGTPLYMSPEQAEHNNLDVDTRTDIYSLGVILYELLTGTTPLEQKKLKEAAYNEILRLIKEVEPPKPSTRLSGSASLPSIAAQRSIEPKQLSKSLVGDLDWIVMKSLDKERSRRYETANAVAMEIQRFLHGQPVEACPPSTMYRMKKFVHRNMTSVAVAASFLLLLLGSSVVSWVLFAHAKHARDLAIAAEMESLTARDRALEAQRIAAHHLLTATSEKDRADNHAIELKQKLYDYNIIKAGTAYRDNQLTTLTSLLSDCLPEQRGWEWSYLHRMANAQYSIQLPGGTNWAFSVTPENNRIMAVDSEGVVRCADISNGDVIWSRKSEIRFPANIVVSPNGDQVLVAGSEKGIHAGAPDVAILQAFQTENGELLWTERPVGKVAYLPSYNHDGTQFLITIMNRSLKTSEVQLRSSKDGDQLWTVPAAAIASAIFDSLGARVFISETSDEQMRGSSFLRCLNAVDHSHVWKIHREGEVSGIALNPEGSELIATGEDLALVVFDALSGSLKQRYRSTLQERGLIVQGCSAKNFFLTVSNLGHFVVWDWKSKRPISDSRLACDPASVQFTPDGSRIAYWLNESRAISIRPIQRQPDALPLIGHKSGYKGARFLDNENLCSVGTEGAWRQWHALTGQELASKSLDGAGLELDVASNGKWIVAATTHGTQLWDRSSGQILQKWPQDGETWFAKFDATGTLLATAGKKGILRVYDGSNLVSDEGAGAWSTSIERPILEFKASTRIDGLAISQDGRVVYTLGTPGCEVLAHEIKTGGRRLLRSGQAGQAGRTAELSPDGKFLALGVNQTVEIWDIQSNSLKAVLKGAKAHVICLTFDRTGTRLFAGSEDGDVSLWSLASQELLFTFPAHSSLVVCLSMSPDNSTLASTSFGGEIKLWEANSQSQEVMKQREMVESATKHANQMVVRYKTPNVALERLSKDDTISEELKPTVVALLQARRNAPVSIQALAQGLETKINVLSSTGDNLKSRPYDLKEKLHAVLAKDLPSILDPSRDPPDTMVAASWHTLSRSLVRKSRFNLEPAELIGLLQTLKEDGDTTHYVRYLKAMAHISVSEWQAAEIEMTGAIELVPPKSPLWFVYAFRLSFLRAYVDKWDAYDALCQDALEGFKDSEEQNVLDRLAKMCLFSNASKLDLSIPLAIADRNAAQGTMGASRVFAHLTSGIADLRRNHYESALEHLDEVTKAGFVQDTVGNEILVASSKMYSSIALHHLGRNEEARQRFDESAKSIGSFPQNTGWWPDWMMATIAMKQAKDLIMRDDATPIRP